MPVRMELARILIRETDDTHVVELREADAPDGSGRVFPIVIGLNEAAAIERRLMGQQPPRPQTHELLASVIDQLGYTLERVVINDLRHDKFGNGTFYARLYLRKRGGNGNAGTIDIDSRPSDAIALGVANDTPIYVEEHVLDEVCRVE
jgi:bifunctional DNase/RNase